MYLRAEDLCLLQEGGREAAPAPAEAPSLLEGLHEPAQPALRGQPAFEVHLCCRAAALRMAGLCDLRIQHAWTSMLP